MAKTDFSDAELVTTLVVGEVLNPLVLMLDRADRLGVLVYIRGYPAVSDEAEFYQTAKRVWRKVCAIRRRHPLMAQVRPPHLYAGREVGWEASLSGPLAKRLEPLTHWLFVAADTTNSGKGRAGTPQHLSFSTTASTWEAQFVGPKGMELWEAFLDNLRVRPDWRGTVVGAPVPSSTPEVG